MSAAGAPWYGAAIGDAVDQFEPSRRVIAAISRSPQTGMTSRSMTRRTSAGRRFCAWSRLSHSSATAAKLSAVVGRM